MADEFIELVIRAAPTTHVNAMQRFGAVVRVGRGDGVDLRIDDASVSGHHATLRIDASGCLLTDHGSLNGTVVGGVALEPEHPRLLRKGALIRFGSVWVEIKRIAGASEEDALPPLEGATKEIALGLVARMMHSSAAPLVRIVEGNGIGRALRLTEHGRRYSIGRDPACDLAVDDASVSRVHASVELQGAREVQIGNEGATNGLRVGKRELPHATRERWRPQDQVRLGAIVISLEMPNAVDLTIPAPNTNSAVEATVVAPSNSDRADDDTQHSVPPAESHAAASATVPATHDGGTHAAPIATVEQSRAAARPSTMRSSGPPRVVLVGGAILVIFTLALLVLVFLPR
jgi:pSer/pThr/pTyr-binding forkhead associated (FHA) protein